MKTVTVKAKLLKAITKAIEESKVSDPLKVIKKALHAKLDLEKFKSKTSATV